MAEQTRNAACKEGAWVPVTALIAPSWGLCGTPVAQERSAQLGVRTLPPRTRQREWRRVG